MKFEATIRVRYEVLDEQAPEAYGTSDPKKMAEIDQDSFKNYPESLLALAHHGPEGFTVEVRHVE